MSNTTRIAFIGCGGNSKGHGRSVASAEGTEIVGLVDVNSSAISNFKSSVELNNELSPIIIKSQSLPNYLGIIMPLKL